jgi:cytochrome P450
MAGPTTFCSPDPPPCPAISLVLQHPAVLASWRGGQAEPLAFSMVDTLEMIKVKINKITAEREHDKRTQRTIFHDVLSSDPSPSEKTTEGLSHDAVIVLVAGTETTARAPTYISFELTQNPKMLEELRRELKSVLPNPDMVPISTLEHILVRDFPV